MPSEAFTLLFYCSLCFAQMLVRKGALVAQLIEFQKTRLLFHQEGETVVSH